MVADVHEQLVTHEIQNEELAVVEHGTEATPFAVDLV